MNVERSVIELPPGYRCREAGMFMAQLDELSQRMHNDLRDIAPSELEWQPMPGMNTIGMLLTHLAIVEVFWTQIGVMGVPEDSQSVLGIGLYDDGLPFPEGGLAPAHLAGKSLSYFADLFDRARAYMKRAAVGLSDADLETMRTRTRHTGAQEELNVRWVIYHVLEHFAGHYGQILLLRHQFRDTRRPSTTPA